MKVTWKNDNELNIPAGYRMLSGNEPIEATDLTIWTFGGNDPVWKQIDPSHIGNTPRGYSVIRALPEA